MNRLFLLIFASLFLPVYFINAEESQAPLVLVSVAPHKYFVEKIAGDTLQVMLMVPAGASAHSYEPTPKQILTASHADIWFQLGESFEKKAGKALKSYRPGMIFVDMRSGLDLIYDAQNGCVHCRGEDASDLHIWLSARLAKKQAQTISGVLIGRYPHNAPLYRKNLQQFEEEMDMLDQEISKTLAPLVNRTILVSHPAYAYFCRDYNLQQLSIEFEGKDPSPRQLTSLLETVRKLQINKIFTQPQYSNKGAILIAQEIGAEVVSLNPYAQDYIQSMREIARQFATL